jgi:dTDP-4-dehydrorhamnose reductase
MGGDPLYMRTFGGMIFVRILATGANGKLGKEVARQGHEHEPILVGHNIFNITDSKTVSVLMHEVKPQAEIHCAVYTNVDGTESDVDRDFHVNVVGASNIAVGCL